MKKRFLHVTIDVISIVLGTSLVLLNFLKIVPGFGTALEVAFTFIIAYFGFFGLAFVVLAVADLLSPFFMVIDDDDSDNSYDDSNSEYGD